MNILNSKIYLWSVTASNFLLLNLIWLICCIPIITIFPATTAMFGVIRQWKLNQDTGVFGLFFHMLKENFKQSVFVEILWVLAVFILYIDFQFLQTTGSILKWTLSPFLLLFSLFLLFITVYLFPVMIHYNATWMDVIKNSFLLSVGNLPTTFLSLITLGIVTLIIFIIPLAVLILCSVGAHIIYLLCHRSFERVAKQL